MKKLTTEQFIERANVVHNNKYDYSLVDYVNNRTKIKIICPEHGIFEQVAGSHLNRGCDKCGGTYKPNLIEFIEKSKKIHDNKYDYSLVEYKNNSTNIKIICPEHGIFIQSPSTHTHKRKSGCPKCGNLIKGKKLTNNDFVERAIKIHGNVYDYSLVNYITAHKKIRIICRKHGEFSQKPNSHLNGRGCPNCNQSNGEKTIKKFLTEYNIKFKHQKTFKKCVYKYVLRFDFYLPDYNLCIEYNGIQHYTPIEFFGGLKKFQINKERFEIKLNFCEKNEIGLEIIKYDENVIERLTNLLACYNINMP